VGTGAGLLQGATGSSVPVITVYFFQIDFTKTAFLFLINLYFTVVDTTQILSLVSVGVYSRGIVWGALAATGVTFPALLTTLRFQNRISEGLFRKAVLVVLAATGLVLILQTRLG